MNDFYGVLKRETSPSTVDRAVEEIRLVGYSTIESGYSKEQLVEIKKICEKIATEYKEKYVSFNLIESGESNNHRAPLLQNNKFLEIAANPNVLEVVSSLIVGGFFLNQQNLVINPPSSENYNQLKFHRDLPYQHFVSSRPIAINALLAVDDFTLTNGATIVIPASHKVENFSSDEVINRHAFQIEVKAGTFLILDCMTFHAAGTNRSMESRIGINHVYSTLMLRPQIEWSRALAKGDIQILSASHKKLLGLDQEIAGSVEEFLSIRRKRKM